MHVRSVEDTGALLLAAGSRAWPDVELEAARFLEHVRERAPDGEGADALHAADLYLACACAEGDARALAAFENHYLRAVPDFLTGVERDPAAIDEVKQLVRERLFVAQAGGPRAKILDYSGRGSLGSWLRVVTLRVAANRRRALGEKRRASFDEEQDAADLLPSIDPELAIVKARYKGEFDDALRAAFAGLSERERVVFRMHFIDGMNIERIGIVFQVHRATVARWIAAAREGVLERTMALLGDRLRLTPPEFESLLNAVRSSLDVSLGGLLAEP